MHARGFSLIETVVVIAVVSVLLAIGTLRFNEYSRRYRTEAQTRMIYAELLKARASALYERRPCRVKLYADRFEVYSSTQDNARGAAPVRTQTLSFPITSSTGNGVTGHWIDFDSRGLTGNLKSICVDNGEDSAGVDSLVVSRSRVAIGKKEPGHACNADYITIK